MNNKPLKNIKVTTLSEISKKNNLTPYKPPQEEPIDLIENDKKKFYIIVDQLKNAWIYIYQEYIYESMYNKANIAITVKKVKEIIKALDKVMTDLPPNVSKERGKIINYLESLIIILENNGKSESDLRKSLRNISDKINKTFIDMSIKTAYPSLYQRLNYRIFGKKYDSIIVTKEELNKLTHLANIVLDGLSISFSGVIGMEKEYREAFRTLHLNIWHTQDDVENAYRRLANIYHPDKNNDESSLTMMTNINKARKILLEDFFPKLSYFSTDNKNKDSKA